MVSAIWTLVGFRCGQWFAMMAMIGVVQAGEAVNIDEVRGAADQYKSNFMMNADRLTSYLAQL